MRTTIRKAHRWPIGASRTADHALFRDGESLPGCRTAMVDQAVDTTWQVVTDSSTRLRTVMTGLAADSSTGRRTPTVGLAADTTRHVATDSSTGHRTAMRRTGQEAASAAGTRPPASPDHRWRRVTGSSRHLAGSSPTIARRPQAIRAAISGSGLLGFRARDLRDLPERPRTRAASIRLAAGPRRRISTAAGTRRRALEAAMPRRALAAARISAVGTRSPVEAAIPEATAAANITIEAAAGS